MKVKVMTPQRIVMEIRASKVRAEAHNGSFSLLPYHIDFTASLPPGIVSIQLESGGEKHLATDEAVLVKIGQDVLIASPRAFMGEIDMLKRQIEEEILKDNEREKKTRSAIARIESDMVRRFMELSRL